MNFNCLVVVCILYYGTNDTWSNIIVILPVSVTNIRVVKDFNLSLLAKQCWRIIQNPDSFWVQALKARYLPHSLWFSTSWEGHRASWAWVSLLQARDIIKFGFKWQVCNGKMIVYHNLTRVQWFLLVLLHLVLSLIDGETRMWRIDQITPFINNHTAGSPKFSLNFKFEYFSVLQVHLTKPTLAHKKTISKWDWKTLPELNGRDFFNKYKERWTLSPSFSMDSVTIYHIHASVPYSCCWSCAS